MKNYKKIKVKKIQNNNLRAYAFGPVLFTADSAGSLDATLTLINLDSIEMIKAGFRSLSPGMKIRKFDCSICKNDFEICDHLEGQIYDGNICQTIVAEMDWIEVSLVANPEDPKARVTDLLIVEKNGNYEEYTGHGFPSDKKNRRFKHIQQANKNS